MKVDENAVAKVVAVDQNFGVDVDASICSNAPSVEVEV